MVLNNNKKMLKLDGKYVSVVQEGDDLKIVLWSGEVLSPFEDLQLDESNVDIENTKQAKIYAVYANAYALAVLQKYELETELKVAEANLDEFYRTKLKEEGEKLTETLIKRNILSDERYIEGQRLLDKYNAIVILLKEILNAFVHKREALFHFSTSARMLTRAQIEEVKRTFEEQTKGFTKEDVW
jgi:hypothetical protein